MEYDQIKLERDVLRDEEFINHQAQLLYADFEEAFGFRSIGEVYEQMSFNFNSTLQ